MKRFSAGRFVAETYTDGFLRQIMVFIGPDEAIRMTHDEISDLQYVLKRAKREIKRTMPSDCERLEM